MGNTFDGVPFTIKTLDGKNPLQGYIVREDGAAFAIRGDEPGSRYALAPVASDGISYIGDAATYIDGPWVGNERIEFLAKRGGVTTGDPAKDVAPWPAWATTPEKYTALLAPDDEVHAAALVVSTEAAGDQPLGASTTPTTGSSPAPGVTVTRYNNTTTVIAPTPPVAHQSIQNKINLAGRLTSSLDHLLADLKHAGVAVDHWAVEEIKTIARRI